ncbi:hypothetical protein EYB53_022405 [Candidatus Chloroploca sp. M-50]|uniref:Uncharacterized protein n=1 Tax=Candidatus Chloroploca mongolica TaxID=2528176 RepID=A0ABS4DGB9_9CHLR|nr:hypothetical protein [Candidatus Chloroploca mongolica]MBP1468482.1 hypothetical protein [Candidatus Chloroploca mongolica]
MVRFRVAENIAAAEAKAAQRRAQLWQPPVRQFLCQSPYDKARPAGWSEQSHSNDVAPKYTVVFPNDAVSTLRNIIAPDYRLEHFAECAVSR